MEVGSDPGDVDLLSEIVQTLQIGGSSYHRAYLNRPFGIEKAAKTDHIRVCFVLRGRLWLESPGLEAPVCMVEGDVFLLLSGATHRLVDAPGARAVPWEELVRQCAEPHPERPQRDDADAAIVLGEFGHVDGLLHPVFESLPDLVHASTGTADAFAAMRGALRLIDMESVSGQPGAPTIINRLSEVILIQVLRSWLDQHPDAAGVVRAMRDPRMGRVLSALHAKPEHDWTVAEMGRVAAMSRTAFATSFKTLLGIPPMNYLARWRLTVARTLLLREDLTILDVAQRVGYRSQASFSQAFRESSGAPPGRYRERARREVRQSARPPGPVEPQNWIPALRPRSLQNVRRGTVSVF